MMVAVICIVDGRKVQTNHTIDTVESLALFHEQIVLAKLFLVELQSRLLVAGSANTTRTKG